MDKEELKKAIDEFKELAEEEYEGLLGKLVRCFNYEHLDPSQWGLCSRYRLVATYIYRKYPRSSIVYDALWSLLKSRDEAIRADLNLDRCPV